MRVGEGSLALHFYFPVLLRKRNLMKKSPVEYLWAFEESVGRNFLPPFFSQLDSLSLQAVTSEYLTIQAFRRTYSTDVTIAYSSIQCLGCGIRILFRGEKEKHRLRLLNTALQKPTKLDRQTCSVNLNNSWYIGCRGEEVPLKETKNVFRLEWQKAGNNHAYLLKVRSTSHD